MKNITIVIGFVILMLTATTGFSQEKSKSVLTKPTIDPDTGMPIKPPRKIGPKQPLQTADSQARKSRKPIQGVVVKKNTATLKRGYEFVELSDNQVSVRAIATKNAKGTLKCGCVGNGSCSLSTRGSSVSCLGDCGDGCTLLVEVEGVSKTVR